MSFALVSGTSGEELGEWDFLGKIRNLVFGCENETVMRFGLSWRREDPDSQIKPEGIATNVSW